MQKNLVLHIGFPKTGTTTLQKFFFPRYHTFLGKHQPTTPDSLLAFAARGSKNLVALDMKLLESYRMFSGLSPPPLGIRDGTAGAVGGLSAWVDEVVRYESWPLIVSNESFSEWPRGDQRWPIEGTTEAEIAEPPIVLFLFELRRLLPSKIALKVVLTLRNQSDFVASLSSELGIEEYFTSTSFEQLLARKDPYLDYYKLVQGLENVVGAQNLLTLIFEDGIEANVSKLVAFIGRPDTDTDFGPETKIPTENRKRIGEDSWHSHRPRIPILRMLLRSTFWKALRWSRWYSVVQPFARSLGFLLNRLQGAWQVPFFTEISDDHRLRIRAVYSSSNKVLSEHLGRSLSNLGY